MALLLPNVAAQGTDVAGREFRFQSVRLESVAEASATRLRAVAFPPSAENDAWTLTAARIHVNTTTVRYYETARPPTFHERQNIVEEGVYYDEKDLEDVNARLIRINRNGTFGLVPRGPVEVSAIATDAVLEAAKGENVVVVSAEMGLVRSLPFAPGAAEARLNVTQSKIAGAFGLHLMDTNVEVHGPNGLVLLQSGSWTEPIFPGSSSNAPVRYRYVQWLRLDVSSGVLQATEAASRMRIVADRLQVKGDLHLTFASDNPGVSFRYAAESASLDARNHTGEANGMRATLTPFQSASAPVAPDHALLRDANRGVGPAAVGNPEAWWWVAVIILVGLSLGLAGFVIARIPSVTDIEWAILRGRNRRALRMARRLTRREATNPDALFLYGVTLLGGGRLAEAVHRLDPQARRLPRGVRRGVAFVLAVAAQGLGDEKLAREWFAEASEDKALRAELERLGFARPTPVADAAYA